MQHRLLLVDDDPLILSAVQAALVRQGYHVDTASSGEQAVICVQKALHAYSLAILDYRMQGEDGAVTAERIHAIDKDLYILIFSGDDSREAVKRAWDAGAVGFLEKSNDILAFLTTVRNWCNKYEETRLGLPTLGSLGENAEIISRVGLTGRSASLMAVAEKTLRYRNKSDNVLILGETGTGKEKIARALHGGAPEKLFAVNCASYSGNNELMESHLFGYVKGSFTGATQDQKGLFEIARGGTVFLDEVHTLDLKSQQRLLRVLQEKTVRPVGGVREYSVEFRLIAAAKPEIEDMVERGTFIPDLFERLNVLRLSVPPLRERLEDVRPLISYFCDLYERETGERKIFLNSTAKYMENYPWPRNVRELENTVRRLCVDVEGDKIAPDHLDAKFFSSKGPASSPAQPSLRERWNGVMSREVENAVATSSSKREAARKLGIPESSLRSILKRIQAEGGSSGLPC